MTYLMDPDVKRRWLEALRSGRYKHGSGYLRSADNCFCAFGVLADVLRRGEGFILPYGSPAYFWVCQGGGDSSSIRPVGLPEFEEIPDDIVNEIMHRNDRYTSFDLVIDYIERAL